MREIITYADAYALPDGAQLRDAHEHTWEVRNGALRQYGRKLAMQLNSSPLALPHGPFRTDVAPDGSIVTYGDAQALPEGTQLTDPSGSVWVRERNSLRRGDGRDRLSMTPMVHNSMDALIPGPMTVTNALPTVDAIPDEGARNLATRLMLASAQDNLNVASGLAESYLRRALRAEAELSLIRELVGDMYSGPWAPNSERVLDALYPDETLVTLRAENQGV